jgi:hypothetical protein
LLFLHDPAVGHSHASCGRAIYDVIHEDLLSLNLSYFMFDLKRLNDSLGIQFEYTQIAYLNAEQRNRGQPGQQP